MDVKRLSKRLLPYIFILLISFIIIFPQIKSHTFISGIDYYFHMSRTYETAMQIKTGHFSYFLSLFSWQHNARILNAVYGPIGGYVSGLVLLLAKSWYRWGLIISFLSLLIAGSTMYCLGRYWHLRPVVNLLISTLYMLSTPLNDFVYSRTFAGFGAAFVPLVFLMISEILVKKDVKSIKLAIVLVIIIEIHLMTFVLSMIFLSICIMLALILAGQKRKQLFIHVCESAILTIILSFNVWGAILEVYSSNLHHIVSTFYNPVMGTQHTNTIMGITSSNVSLLQLPTLIGPLVAILLLFTLVIWIMDLKRTNYIISFLMVIGIVCFWLSSQWFPWRLLSHHLLMIGKVIQFPKRFLPLSLVPLYLVAEYYLSKITRIKRLPRYMTYPILIFLCIIVGDNGLNDYEMLQRSDHYYNLEVINWNNTHFIGRYNNKALKRSLYDTHPGNFIKMVEKPVSDYMPTSYENVKHPYGMYRQTYGKQNAFRWSLASHHGERIMIKSRSNEYQMIPLVKYAHTHVILNGRQILPKRNQIGAMIALLKDGTNWISIHYVPSTWYIIGIWISLAAWLYLIIYLIMYILDC